jgi:hypothetical protein
MRLLSGDGRAVETTEPSKVGQTPVDATAASGPFAKCL